MSKGDFIELGAIDRVVMVVRREIAARDDAIVALATENRELRRVVDAARILRDDMRMHGSAPWTLWHQSTLEAALHALDTMEGGLG